MRGCIVIIDKVPYGFVRYRARTPISCLRLVSSLSGPILVIMQSVVHCYAFWIRIFLGFDKQKAQGNLSCSETGNIPQRSDITLSGRPWSATVTQSLVTNTLCPHA